MYIYPRPYIRGQNKKVYRIDEKGNILEEFDKPQDANKKYGLHHTKEICDGKRKSEKGFYWRWGD